MPSTSEQQPGVQPTPQERQPTPQERQPTPQERLEALLAAALTQQSSAEVLETVLAYRSSRFSVAEWTVVADLLRLGLAVFRPVSVRGAKQIGWALAIHARVHLDAGTSRTVPGWYGPDAVQTTLNSSYNSRTLAAHSARLGRISAALVTPTTPAPRVFGRYATHGPYNTAELNAIFDFTESIRHDSIRVRVQTLLWLTLGTGVWSGELRDLTGTSVTYGQHALLVELPGNGGHLPPRTVPVFHASEQPLAALAAAVGAGSLWLGKVKAHGLADSMVKQARFPPTVPAVTNGRLRATWLALVIGAGAPLSAVLTAGGIQGDSTSFGRAATQVLPLHELDAQRALRGSDGPLPVAGQLLLPGARHPAPQVPLRSGTS